jgi:hypothetical protein
VLVRFDHVASRIVNADLQRICRRIQDANLTRKNQLKQMEQFLEQNPTLADKLKKASWRLAPAVQPEITKNE